jgi:hypothetical protein
LPGTAITRSCEVKHVAGTVEDGCGVVCAVVLAGDVEPDVVRGLDVVSAAFEDEVRAVFGVVAVCCLPPPGRRTHAVSPTSTRTAASSENRRRQ